MHKSIDQIIENLSSNHGRNYHLWKVNISVVCYSVTSMNTAVLLQTIQFAINIIFIPIFIIYLKAEAFNSLFGQYNLPHACAVLVIGIVNIVICFAFPRCKSKTSKRETVTSLVWSSHRHPYVNWYLIEWEFILDSINHYKNK